MKRQETANRKEKIHQWMQNHREEGIQLLQRIVQEPSKPGSEAHAQAIIAEQLDHMGLKVDIWELDGERLQKHAYFYSPRTDFTGSPNVVGLLKGAGEGRSMILNGHIDVVPEGDETQWSASPFSGKVEDGKMYGRGVTDMKGGLVSMLLAIQCLQELTIRLQGDVIFQSVVEEESGGAGTLAAILRGYQADAALIPEPTGMRIFPKQQGSMWFRIWVKGRSAHGGTRYEGVSAIEKSMLVIEHIRQLEQLRNERVTDPLYKNTPIPIPINIGVVQGGDWPSSVPDLVKLEGRMGVAPEEKLASAALELETWLSQLAGLDAWFQEHPPVIEWFGARWVSGAIPLEHELMNILAKQYQTTLQKKPVIEASPWGTDGGLLTVLADTPAIVFGPGITELAHFPNEFIVLDTVFEAAEVIANTLVEWCGEAEKG